jgi:hypothetical protein
MPGLTDELAAFYLSQRIAVDAFACPSQSDCDRVAATKGQRLLHGSEAHVGSRYGHPFRIVVLSLSDIEGTARLSGHDEYEQGLCVEWSLNPHLVGTKEFLESVLAPEVVGRDVFRHFALTRAAKCVLEDGSAKPPDACFWHCRQFVLPELEILNPHLVVTQGREAWWAVEKQSEALSDHLIKSLVPSDVAALHPAHSLFEGYLREHVHILRLSSKTIVLLKLVHPSAQAGQWPLMRRLGAVSLLGWTVRRLVSEVAA